MYYVVYLDVLYHTKSVFKSEKPLNSTSSCRFEIFTTPFLRRVKDRLLYIRLLNNGEWRFQQPSTSVFATEGLVIHLTINFIILALVVDSESFPLYLCGTVHESTCTGNPESSSVRTASGAARGGSSLKSTMALDKVDGVRGYYKNFKTKHVSYYNVCTTVIS